MKSIPSCHFNYDNENCDNETITCEQCPVYWEYYDIDPEAGYEEYLQEQKMKQKMKFKKEM